MKRRKTSGWPWLSLGLQTAKLAMEAQQVVTLRMARLAAGGPNAYREATRMVTEKVAAFGAAQSVILGGASGNKNGQSSKRVLALYRRRVAANKRRLSK
jgi:hypothetical protein